MSQRTPLLGSRPLNTPVAWCDGQAVTAVALLARAAALAPQLPAQGAALNLCQNRLHFSVGLLAAALRGHQSLLPPNAMPATLAQLAPPGQGTYVLYDDPALDLSGHIAINLAQALTCDAQLDDLDEAAPCISAPDGPTVCLLTSGSTGQPQAQYKAWDQLQLNIAAQAQRLAHMLQWPDLNGLNLVATVPPQHSYGFESSVLLALLGGAAFDVTRPFYPADIADALARLPRPRGLVTTPFHLKTLLLSGVPLPAVDLVLSATAPLTPQLAARAEAAMGACLIEIYGCTEAGQVAARRTTAGEVWTTLGDLRVTEHSTPEGPQFSVLGGHVQQKTVLADVLVLQDDQHFRLLGRTSDIIHVAGKRSSLAHLNFHLNRIEGVDDGAFWLDDDVAESVVRPIAFVVAPLLTAKKITTALREHLEPAFVPRRVVFVDALPREDTGKLKADIWRSFVLRTLARRDARATPP